MVNKKFILNLRMQKKRDLCKHLTLWYTFWNQHYLFFYIEMFSGNASTVVKQ